MTDDNHRINRNPVPEEDEGEALVCDYCGAEYTDRRKYERHVDREKREQFKGNPIGEAILEADRGMRNDYR